VLLLDEKILAVHAAFDGAAVPHAFGGALALAYYGTPRGTQDIDVNVFVAASESDRVLGALAQLGVAIGGARERKQIRERGQVRLRWERTPIDLFFSYDPLHASCLTRIRSVPFGAEAELPILTAEDLVIFKVLFDRPKDWVDVAEVLYARGPAFDASYTLDWLRRILETRDARLERIEKLLRSPAS
jgi:hypothetical protein